MSVKKRTLTYGLAAVVLAIFLVASASILGPLAGQAGLMSTLSSTRSTSQTNSSTTAATTTTGSSFGTNPQSPPNFLVLLTDPPVVPIGTSSLALTYSNVDLHVKVNGTGSSWVSTNSTGTVELLSLVNVSKTIAATNLPNGSVVDQVRFDIASVQITINGTVYNVTSVTSKLVVPLSSEQGIKTLSAALVDLSPKVVEVVTGGNITAFVMVPTATAIIRDSSQITSGQSHVGHESNLTTDDQEEIHHAQGKVSILASTLSVSGNVTDFSIQIINNANTSVALSGLSLNGEFNGTLTQIATCASASTSTSVHSEATGSTEQSGSNEGDSSSTTTTTTTESNNATTTVFSWTDNQGVDSSNDSSVTTTSNSSSSTNGNGPDALISPADESSNVTTTTSVTQVHTTEIHSDGSDSLTSRSSVENCAMSSDRPDFMHGIIFTTSANSSVLVPVMGSSDGEHDISPLIILPNQTITLTFHGVINATFLGGEDGDFHSQSTLVMYPISGNSYEVNLALSSDAESTVQVTAT